MGGHFGSICTSNFDAPDTSSFGLNRALREAIWEARWSCLLPGLCTHAHLDYLPDLPVPDLSVSDPQKGNYY